MCETPRQYNLARCVPQGFPQLRYDLPADFTPLPPGDPVLREVVSIITAGRRLRQDTAKGSG